MGKGSIFLGWWAHLLLQLIDVFPACLSPEGPPVVAEGVTHTSTVDVLANLDAPFL